MKEEYHIIFIDENGEHVFTSKIEPSPKEIKEYLELSKKRHKDFLAKLNKEDEEE